MNLEISIDGKDIWDYSIEELGEMRLDRKRFNINERAIIDDVQTCKIESVNFTKLYHKG